MTGRVSFGIPVHNGERFLAAALTSIQEQDLPDIEIVVSDNGSTDGTEELCRAAAAGDDRIRYVRSPTNRGGAWNYDRVWELCTAPYFSWMAADDVKLPGFASACLAALDDPAAVFACPRTQLIDADGVVFEDLNDENLGVDAATPARRVRNLLRTQASHLMYGVIRTEVLRATRGLLPMVGDDMVLLTELLCRGRMATVDTRLFWQRRHHDQGSAQADAQVKWHDPDASVAFSFPQLRLNAELYRAVALADLPAAERVRCWAEIAPAWVLPRWRGMGHDVLVAGAGVGTLARQAVRGRA